MSLSLRQRGSKRLWYVRGTVRIGQHVETVREHSTGTSDRDTAESYLRKLQAEVSHKLLFRVGGNPTKSAISHEAVGKGQTVYFLRARDGRIKIGVSGDHEKRKQWLQNAHGEPLEVIAAIAGGRALEQMLHVLFAEYRTNNEWYRRRQKSCGASPPRRSALGARVGKTWAIA
jgi:hypothetical protein